MVVDTVHVTANTRLRFLAHSFPQDLDLLLHFDPQHQLLQIVVAHGQDADPIPIYIVRCLAVKALPCIGTFGPPRDGKKGCHKGFLHVGEAKFVRNVGNGAAEIVWELDFLVVGELLLPEMAVSHALVEVWVREEILSVES
jgi:hypothetical protein